MDHLDMMAAAASAIQLQTDQLINRYNREFDRLEKGSLSTVVLMMISVTIFGCPMVHLMALMIVLILDRIATQIYCRTPNPDIWKPIWRSRRANPAAATRTRGPPFGADFRTEIGTASIPSPGIWRIWSRRHFDTLGYHKSNLIPTTYVENRNDAFWRETVNALRDFFIWQLSLIWYDDFFVV